MPFHDLTTATLSPSPHRAPPQIPLLPDLDAPAILNFNREVTAAEFEAFCPANPDLRTELTAHGEIAIMPPVGGESSYRSADVCTQLGNWAKATRTGKTFDSSAAFVLPSDAILSPDAAWVANQKLQLLTPAQRCRFLPLVPDFIAEVLSPSDRRPATEAKMLEWIVNGVALAWLIDGDTRTVTIYRHQLPQKLTPTSSNEQPRAPSPGSPSS